MDLIPFNREDSVAMAQTELERLPLSTLLATKLVVSKPSRADPTVAVRCARRFFVLLRAR
jgi:hypothetical protein